MKLTNFLVNLFVLVNIFRKCDSLNILVITPHPGKSHQLVFEPLFKKLVTNGHNITHITQFPVKIESTNWRTINVAFEEKNTTELHTFNKLTGTRLNRYTFQILMARATHLTCDGLNHPNLQSFLHEEHHFDLVIIEIFNTNCFMGVANKYNAPIIGIHSCTWMPWMYQWFSNPYNPGYLPGLFLGLPVPMNFFQRLENTVNHLYTNFLYNYIIDWLSNNYSKQYTGIDLYENGDIMSNLSLLLINTHFTLNLPAPLVPNVIEVAGIHLDSQPIKKLPQNLEQFISESKHGVIYMGMGSTIRGDSFPEAKQKEFLKAFAKLPQRIIWKWESEMADKPDNVLTTRWAPQRDILCHPNVKVFISHSGLLGTIESVDCGKPMLLLPQLGDQFTNAMVTQKLGVGLDFTLDEINEEVLLEALKKLLSSEFAESAKALSKRFKDRPVSPMDTALYWINYIVENNGAPYMKSLAADMPTYQYLLLDVSAFLLFVLFIYLYIIYKITKIVIKKYRSKQKKIKKT